MKTGRVYGSGLLLIGLGAALMSWSLQGTNRTAALISVLVCLVIQGPLGWWLIRSVGTPRFLGVWVTGILTRFVILGGLALVVFPAQRWPLSPGLLIVGGVLFALLLLEGLALWLEHSQVEPR
ncbi:MAG: hypothetical protein ABI679_08995 [Gemmatimonadota bacterium]